MRTDPGVRRTFGPAVVALLALVAAGCDDDPGAAKGPAASTQRTTSTVASDPTLARIQRGIATECTRQAGEWTTSMTSSSAVAASGPARSEETVQHDGDMIVRRHRIDRAPTPVELTRVETDGDQYALIDGTWYVADHPSAASMEDRVFEACRAAVGPLPDLDQTVTGEQAGEAAGDTDITMTGNPGAGSEIVVTLRSDGSLAAVAWKDGSEAFPEQWVTRFAPVPGMPLATPPDDATRVQPDELDAKAASAFGVTTGN